MKQFLTLRLAVCVAMAGGALPVLAGPVISEFMASNHSSIVDQDGDHSDWIEIYNPDPQSISLEGWSLTDNSAHLKEWTFPNVTLGSQQFLVVFASGKNRAIAGAELHTNFNLRSAGEYLALIRPDGAVAWDFAPSFPPQRTDISYGLGADLQHRLFFLQPTPQAPNGAGVIGFVADTKFSRNRGFYDSPFDLTLTTATPNAVIRYTTNGLPPSPTNSFVYSAPLPISATTIVRAAAFADGYAPSNPDTQTYIFLSDVIRQSPTGAPPPGWPNSWGANTRDYGMDPDVVNNPLYSSTIQADLKTIPSFSIVMNLKDLFDPITGIYANAAQDGRAWERPCSIELIYPDGKKGFHINAGIRIRGGYSRSTGNPKHAFRWFFRDEYGSPQLHYPLFDDQGTDTFEDIDLRTFENYSWSFEGDPRGVFIRDQFSRDTQLAMGQPGERGRYYHLYINGQYWGLYNTDERAEASYAATYYGGNKNDYDVIKVEAGPYSLNATDGTMDAWTRLYTLAKAGFASNDAYQKVQGNNPDGTRNPNYERLVEIDNLIDYMLVIFYGGNLDAPISNFLGNTRPNNWYGFRNRTGPDGFRFIAHDSEHTLLNVSENRTGPFTAGDSSVLYSNPQWVFQKLAANPEFRIRLADRIQKHFFNGGALTPQAAIDRFMARKNEIDRAVVGESARWGDSKRTTPLTRNVEWIAEINRIVNSYFPQRSQIVLNQLKAKSWFPSLEAPSFSQQGGTVDPGFQLSISAPAGTIFYTIDGSDPRLPGGTLSPSAQTYAAPFQLSENASVRARALNGTNWSAANEAPFIIRQTFTNLLVTEIMYDPPAQDGLEGDQFEFIELKNAAGVELDLSGVHFSSGIAYTFPNGTKLSPGQFVLLVSNPTAFAAKYPGIPIDGVYSGKLSNSGETIALLHAAGNLITSITYGNDLPWPLSAKAAGFSLVPANPNLNPDPNNPSNWRASSSPGGSPGKDDPPLDITPVWVNEVLTHTDLPQVDAVELFNPNSVAADISFWYLTDDRLSPKKFRIPPGTILPAGGYRVFTENDFNPPSGSPTAFRFSSHGDEVYLYSADASGNLTGYSDGFAFGAAANGVTFGRYVTSTAAILYPAQNSPTLSAPNSGPKVGPVVINEIHYHPAPGDFEFVELKNISPSTVKLYDPQHPTNTWRINGISFQFPTGIELAPDSLLVVANGTSQNFLQKYPAAPGVQVFGPYTGALQDNGELLALQRPDSPDVDAHGAAFVPYVDVDVVRYSNRAPWPTHSDGTGSSIERIQPGKFGNDPVNWRSSPGRPSPGFDNSGNRPPQIDAGPDITLQASAFPAQLALAANASDDGNPNPPGAFSVRWQQINGPAFATLNSPTQLTTSASFPSAGAYEFQVTASDGELQSTATLHITLSRPPSQVTLVPAGFTWKYFDQGQDLGVAWRAPSYDDAAWPSGPAQLGYGDGDEATVVSYGGNAADKYPTTYFRAAFSATNAAAISQLKVKLLRDDGGVVYLNGIEVFRSNMPEGDISYSTLASSTVGGADESAFFEQQIDPSLLKDGSNLIAVEIHQVSTSASSDISFDLALTGDVSFPSSPFDLWQAQFFSAEERTRPDISGQDADPDHDGHTNFQEFVAGTDPKDPKSVLHLGNALFENGALHIRFNAVSGKSYTVQTRDALPGPWRKLADIAPPPADQTADIVDPNPSSTARYYRIVTPRQP